MQFTEPHSNGALGTVHPVDHYNFEVAKCIDAGLRDLLMQAGEYEERKEGGRKDGGILGSIGFGPSEL